MSDGSDERREEEEKTGNRYVTFRVNVKLWDRFVSMYPSARPGDRFRGWVNQTLANQQTPEKSNVG